MYVHESCGHAMQYGGVIAFFGENDLLTPLTQNQNLSQ